MPPTPEKIIKTEAAPEKLTPEQKGELNDFVTQLVDGAPKSAKKPKADAPPADEDAVKKAADEKAAAENLETEKKKVRKVTPKSEPMTPADIAQAVARGVAEATKPKAEPDKKDEKPDELAFLTPKDKKRLAVLTQMEQDDAETYKGLTKKFTDGRKAELEYRAKWEKENPGETFDPEADVHSDFYTKHEVNWDDDDYSTAVARLETAKVRKEYEDKETQRETARKAEARKLELVPAISKEQNQTADAMLKEMGGEFAKVHKEDGSVDAELVKKLLADDPTAETVFKSARYAQAVAAETFRLFNGMAEYDSNKPTPLQQEIIDHLLEQEKGILALPVAEQVDKRTGQAFATYQDWLQMPPEQQAKHWYLDARKLNALRAVDIAQNAKKVIEAEEKRMESWAAKRGLTKAQQQQVDNAAEAAEAERLKAEAAEAATDEKPESPESAGGSGLSVRTGSKEAVPKNPEDAFLKSFIG